MWSLRNNTNYMESGVLVALGYVADNSTEFVENFYLKSRRALEKGRDEAPYAWVFPREQQRSIGTADLVNLLMDQGLEVHTADADLSWVAGDDTLMAGAGSYVVRMDQPYSTLASVLLDRQNVPNGASGLYDDSGWTLPLMHNVKAYRVDDASILDGRMTGVEAHVGVSGGITGAGNAAYVVDNTTDDNFYLLRFRLADVGFFAAEDSFSVGGHAFGAGAFLIDGRSGGRELRSRLQQAVEELGLEAVATERMPSVAAHELELPRIGLIHTWVSTPQNAGWWRYAFDRIGIPYAYLSEQDLATIDLKDFDVLIMPMNGASPQTLVAGTTAVGPTLPWRTSRETPNMGRIDQTDDARAGMGYEGLARLKAFIEDGGVFITEGRSAAFPIEMALIRRVAIRTTRNLQAPGFVARTVRADSTSPILYGYQRELPAYFSQGPVLQVQTNVGGRTTPEWYKDAVWEAEVPRTVMTFAEKDINMSGMLSGESEMTGAPAIVDVPVGDGHVVLFAVRPFRRWNTQGAHGLVFNTVLNWNDLRVGWPDRPTDTEDEDEAALLQYE
jgi:hypothetical protein